MKNGKICFVLLCFDSIDGAKVRHLLLATLAHGNSALDAARVEEVGTLLAWIYILLNIKKVS